MEVSYNTIMDQTLWKSTLSQLPLGEIHLFETVGSTNQIAEDLIAGGAPNFTLVAADRQTEGRGRMGRSWMTRAGQALAFSLVLYPQPQWDLQKIVGRLSGLSALAVATVLQKKYQLPALIKWPNDVLIRNRKVCGVLVEGFWQGDQLRGIVLGVGINVHAGSIPKQAKFQFPATSLAAETEHQLNRLPLLMEILTELIQLTETIMDQNFFDRWQASLAYRGQEVILFREGKRIDQGVLLGLTAAGELRLGKTEGEELIYHTGEIRLRLVDRS